MPKKKSNSSKEIIKLGIVIAVIVGVILSINLGLQVALGTPIPIVVVISDSMKPTLNVGDVCLVQRVSSDQYVVGDHNNRTGDIIVFDATGIYPGPDPVIHRIVNRTYDNVTGHYWFTTYGDHNPDPDFRPVEDTRVYGKVVLTIPWIGYIFLFLRGGGVWLVVLVLAVVIVLMFVDTTSKMQKTAKEGLDSESVVYSRRNPGLGSGV